uniref:Globin family profile domain-containing protein n=1 Tax=Sinocyclocheilus grahami TaxID=75366 RepID=A0A672RFY5_SINGR
MSLSDKDKSAVKALWAKIGPKADEIGNADRLPSDQDLLR